MRIVLAALWLILFVVLFAFAVNNTALTDLHFFAGLNVKAPLIALLLAFFVGGFAFGFVALMPAWVRQRVEIRRLRRVVPKPSGLPVVTTTREPADASDAIQSIARGARTTS